MKLKKIIIFYPSFERGGVEKIIINFIRFLLKKNIKIILIASSLTININNKNFEFVKVNKKKIFKFNSRISRAFQAIKNLNIELSRADNKDTIVFSLQSSSIAIPICKYKKFKVVVRNAEDPIESTLHADDKFFSTITFFLKIVIYNFSNGIITNSNGSRRSLSKMLFNKHKIKTIYNPYLKKKIIFKRRFKKKRQILSIGRLVKQKDFFNLIKSFYLFNKKIDTYSMLIVGGGKLRKNLINFIKSYSMQKKIKIVDWKYDLSKYYKESELFILNSLYEGLGNVVIDAVNYELPVIVTKCNSGPNEIILNNKGGYMVPIKSPELLARKISYCINNKNISMKKAFFAKKHINRFDCNSNSQKYLNFLSKVFLDA